MIGTADYMSPEQARGDAIDHRTDLWSLGIVLYEMVAQRRPFDGDTDNHIIAGILDKPLPPIHHAQSLPSGLISIIDRALVKDRAKRYQTARDLLSDLHQLSETLPRSASSIRPIIFSQRTDIRRRLGLIAGIIASLIVGCAIWWWGLNGKETILGPDWFRIESVRQLTFNGRTKLASISPDGKYLAFVVGDEGGTETLFLKQVDQSSEQIKLPPRKIDYEGITFSPDNQTMFVVEKDEKLLGRLYPVPIVGDRPNTPVLVDIDGPVSFSPSGDQFAFVRWTPDRHESALELASSSISGSQPRTLISLQDFTIMRRVAWSPRGDRIAAFPFSNSANANGEGTLDLIDLKGRQSRRVLPNWWLIDQPCWTANGKTLIVSAAARTEGENREQLREIGIRTGEIHDITKDLAGYASATLTRDDQQLAAVKLESKATLWISAKNDFKTGQNASAEAEEHPSLSWSDESHVILNSQRGGYPNLWLLDTSSVARVSLTNEPYIERDATSVPGSTAVVFSSNRSGEFHLWRFDAETNAYTQLTFGPGYDEAPTISPDRKWIVYTSWTANNPRLYKIPVSGGRRSQIGTHLATHPAISPDGKSIACHMPDPNSSRWTVAVIPLDGVGTTQLFPSANIPVRWSPNGAALTSVLTDERGVSNLWDFPIDGSAPRQLTSFDDEEILTFAWSPQGNQLACIRVSSARDAVLFKRQKS